MSLPSFSYRNGCAARDASLGDRMFDSLRNPHYHPRCDRPQSADADVGCTISPRIRIFEALLFDVLTDLRPLLTPRFNRGRPKATSTHCMA